MDVVAQNIRETTKTKRWYIERLNTEKQTQYFERAVKKRKCKCKRKRDLSIKTMKTSL